MKIFEIRINSMLFLSTVLMISLFSCTPDGGDDLIECGDCEEPTNGGGGSTTARKPNIYIYPTENIELEVKINFPQGGEVIESIPDYGEGWHCMVDTNGIINEDYAFLFYESKQPDIWQNSEGWTIKRSELEGFFIENMTQYGFRGHEISDYIDYWIPRLTEFEYYRIYPQDSEIINKVVQLDLSVQPGNILRLFYVIEGAKSLSEKVLEEPNVDSSFSRTDYFITEWGVVLK